MGQRLDELERSIEELMTQAGVDEEEVEEKPFQKKEMKNQQIKDIDTLDSNSKSN